MPKTQGMLLTSVIVSLQGMGSPNWSFSILSWAHHSPTPLVYFQVHLSIMASARAWRHGSEVSKYLGSFVSDGYARLAPLNEGKEDNGQDLP